MHIFVQSSGKIITVDGVSDTATVNNFKETIQETSGIPPDLQCLRFGGNQLQDDFHLADYNIQTGSMFQLSLPLRGGGDEDSVIKIQLLNISTKDGSYFPETIDLGKPQSEATVKDLCGKIKGARYLSIFKRNRKGNPWMELDGAQKLSHYKITGNSKVGFNV